MRAVWYTPIPQGASACGRCGGRPGSATPIHDHHCDCLFGVLSGRLLENHYEKLTGRSAGARAIASYERQTGYIGGNAYESGVIHQMTNDGDAMCVTLHVYAYAPHHAPNSIRQCFAAIDGGRQIDPGH